MPNRQRQGSYAGGKSGFHHTAAMFHNIKLNIFQVCNRLGIPGFEVQFIKEYWTEVFTPFLESYQSGVETPNPDVYCNRHIKFHHFKNFVREKWGISKIATGHYVRLDAGCKTIKASDSALPQHLLYTGLDSSKDQSYFLSMTSVFIPLPR